ncbi:MAG: hypothetical protein M3Q99_16525 [Acidobacteriota bacterium]|nr:hypothetical protein [Acidobacteriota bacterium]
MPNNSLDSIRVISDGINAMNDRLADMLPVAGYNELEKKRDAAIDRLHFLVRLFIKTSTHRYINADSELVVVNGEMKVVLAALEDMQRVIDSATRFVSAIDKFIGAISQIV